MSERIGRSVAIGDAGNDEEAISSIEQIRNGFSIMKTGMLAALVLGNTYSREVRDLRTGDIVRNKDQTRSDAILDSVFKGNYPKFVALMIWAILPLPPAGGNRNPLFIKFERYLDSACGHTIDVPTASKAKEILLL
jgi:hypothetical protein